MNRRDLLKTIGGIGTTAAAGAGALVFTTEGARATADQDFGTATVTSDDGEVQYVAIYGDSIVKWNGFDTEAVKARIETFAKIDGKTKYQLLYDTGKFALDEDDDWGGFDEHITVANGGTTGTIETGIGLDQEGKYDPNRDWEIVGSEPDPDGDDYGLPPKENRLDASLLTNPDEGTTKTFGLTVLSRYTWYDNSGNVILQKDFKSGLSVDVTNEQATATAEGDSGADGAKAE